MMDREELERAQAAMRERVARRRAGLPEEPPPPPPPPEPPPPPPPEPIRRSTYGLPDKAWLNMQDIGLATNIDHKKLASWFDGIPGIIQQRTPYKPGHRQTTYWRIPFDVAVQVIRSKMNK